MREAPGAGKVRRRHFAVGALGVIAPGANESPGIIAYGAGAFSESPDSATGVDPEMPTPDSIGTGKRQHQMQAYLTNSLILHDNFGDRFEMSRLRLPVQLSEVRSLRSELSL